MSDCTWNTSVSDASNGCCHFVAGASLSRISTSSGLTWTRLVASRLLPAHRRGQEVAGVQLLRDLLRRLLRLLVGRRAAARDDLEAGHARRACRGSRRRCRRRSSRLRPRRGSRRAGPRRGARRRQWTARELRALPEEEPDGREQRRGPQPRSRWSSRASRRAARRRTAARTRLSVVGADASESAKATSFADWKRFSRSFSRQCRTMWSSAGETLRPDCVSSGGSSFRIAAIVSLAVSRLNAFLPESISYRIAPKEKMSVR